MVDKSVIFTFNGNETIVRECDIQSVDDDHLELTTYDQIITDVLKFNIWKDGKLPEFQIMFDDKLYIIKIPKTNIHWMQNKPTKITLIITLLKKI